MGNYQDLAFQATSEVDCQFDLCSVLNSSDRCQVGGSVTFKSGNTEDNCDLVCLDNIVQ